MNFFAAAAVIRSRPWIGYPLAVGLSLAALWIRFAAGDAWSGSFFSPLALLGRSSGGLGPGVLAGARPWSAVQRFLIST